MVQNFYEYLSKSVSSKNTMLCVGLDPDEKLLDLLGFGSDYFGYNRLLIDTFGGIAACFKPQIAHYAARGKEGDLQRTIEYIKSAFPTIPVILDAKRGDIGSTASKYAEEAFERYNVDAVTVNPYLGIDSLAPFLDYPGKAIVVLAKTSNPSAARVQNLITETGEPVYLNIARYIAGEIPVSQLLFVVGATYPEDIRIMRSEFPNHQFLVPGVGAQGADVRSLLDNGRNSSGDGMIVNVGRGITALDHSVTPAEYENSIRNKALHFSEQLCVIKKA